MQGPWPYCSKGNIVKHKRFFFFFIFFFSFTFECDFISITSGTELVHHRLTVASDLRKEVEWQKVQSA